MLYGDITPIEHLKKEKKCIGEQGNLGEIKSILSF